MEPEERRGGIGFMSTQKRASRFSPHARLSRSGAMCRRRHQPWNGTDRAGARGSVSLASWARNERAGLGDETATNLVDRLVDLVLVGHKLSARGSDT